MICIKFLKSVMNKPSLADYVKQVDLSSGIYDYPDITLTTSVKKAIKIGNIVNLTIKVKNSGNSTINADTPIIYLPSGAYDSTTPILIPCIVRNATSGVNTFASAWIVNSDGHISLIGANLQADEWLYITVSYAVA